MAGDYGFAKAGLTQKEAKELGYEIVVSDAEALIDILRRCQGHT